MANISASRWTSKQNNHNLPRKQTLSGTNIVIRVAKQRACQNLESVSHTEEQNRRKAVCLRFKTAMKNFKTVLKWIRVDIIQQN